MHSYSSINQNTPDTCDFHSYAWGNCSKNLYFCQLSAIAFGLMDIIRGLSVLPILPYKPIINIAYLFYTIHFAQTNHHALGQCKYSSHFLLVESPKSKQAKAVAEKVRYYLLMFNENITNLDLISGPRPC